MELTWYGLSCFRLTERGKANVVTDPYNTKLGLPALKLKSDIVTISHDAPGHNYLKAVSGYSHALTGPGEYEIGGVFVTGVATRHRDESVRNVLFVIDFNNLTVVHLGDIGQLPSQSQIEDFGEVNVLLVPVGGGSSLNAAQAAELVSMLEPNLVVPMHYAIPGQNLELDSAERFLKEMGVTDVAEESVLRVTSTSLPEETEVVLLQPKI
jgi:L-ascorbate metabolism protein UlaG (beta-lactamase superfamily)